MKKINIKRAAAIGMCCTIISTSTVLAASNTISANDDIKIQINSEWVAGIKPFIENDRTLVSLNEFAEKLGAKVESNSEGTIKIGYEDAAIEFSVGKSSAKIIKNNGGELTEKEISMEIAPKMVNENTFVPLRFISEALGFDVEWDNSLRSVIIKDEDTIITIERPVEFVVVDQEKIDGNELLLDLYNSKHKSKGIHTLVDGDYIYALVSAGVKPTGGYSLKVDSITEVAPGTAYIHVTLNSPEEGSIVTQALTYPNVMVKFEKGGINNFQWDLSADITSDEAEINGVTKMVQSFGEQLKMVSLSAPEDILKDAMKEYYGGYVSPELIEKWLKDPVAAPGRLTSSPWPGRIDVLSIQKTSESNYEVKGNIVEFTSVEMEDGGVAAKKGITLEIQKENGKFVIVNAALDDYKEENKDSVVYINEEYGFSLDLPESWKGYSIQNNIWSGTSLTEENKEITGSIVYIRHPKWTKDNPRQDIPVMVLTLEQWKALEKEEFAIGAAPIGPKKLGENSKYVFALPARYNFEFLTGYEEVEQILENSPLKTFE